MPPKERGFQRFMGKTAVGFGIIRQSTGNPLELSKAAIAEIPRIQESLPKGMKIELNYDSSVFIAQSIKAVFSTIGEAVVLVAIVIFFFLRSLRATIIPLITIPVALTGAFFIMYAFGFTINTLTLLAMVLAVGLVVDDAIVVLENIHRHIENGMGRHAGGADRHPRDRLRGGRHDADAGGRVRAAGLCDGPYRAAVHRVCAWRSRAPWWCRASWR